MDLAWDWDQQRAVAAKGLSGVAEVDLVGLWRPEPVEDAFVQRWMQTVRRVVSACKVRVGGRQLIRKRGTRSSCRS